MITLSDRFRSARAVTVSETEITHNGPVSVHILALEDRSVHKKSCRRQLNNTIDMRSCSFSRAFTVYNIVIPDREYIALPIQPPVIIITQANSTGF